MKKALLVFLAVALVVFVAGSSNAQGKIKFGIGADVAKIIASGFSDVFGIGIGGTAKGYYVLNDMATLTATAGYITFSGKDVTQALGVKWTYGSLSQIPVLVGGRYYFAPASSSFRLYGGFDMGMLFSSYKYDQPAVVVGGVTVFPAQSISFSGSDFSYQPHVGFEASNFDVAVRYLGVSGFGSIAARIGYIFN
jgi:hypothetical protein